MARLNLEAAPTFSASVPIPVAGGDPVPVLMTFKHRTKDELDSFIKARAKKTDDDAFLEMVVGWDLEDEFTPANAKRLLQNYIGAALVTFMTYIDELTKARTKN